MTDEPTPHSESLPQTGPPADEPNPEPPSDAWADSFGPTPPSPAPSPPPREAAAEQTQGSGDADAEPDVVWQPAEETLWDRLTDWFDLDDAAGCGIYVVGFTVGLVVLVVVLAAVWGLCYAALQVIAGGVQALNEDKRPTVPLGWSGAVREPLLAPATFEFHLHHIHTGELTNGRVLVTVSGPPDPSPRSGTPIAPELTAL